jgi:Uma2 family endonuclease
MSESTRLVTAEELARLPDDGYRYELVGGRLIRTSPVSFDHGRVVMRMGFLLSRHLEQREKIEGHLAQGVPFVVVIDPDDKTATTFRPGTASAALRSESDVLDLSDVIHGFRCQREIFE